jgi:DNA repair protein RecN (Recombination protein N)
MLKELRLTNIILVESTTIPFSHCFNVLSGESGSGKSAIMNALNLIAGERCDASSVRHGEAKGVVEAVFDLSKLPEILSVLEEAGIDHEEGAELFIRREITAAGKSRAFINNQLAQLALLKQVTSFLFEIVGQHANQKLLSLDYHRQVLDLFGNHESDVKAFFLSWQEESKTRERLEELVRSEFQRRREIEIARAELEELDVADLKEGEEEEVFSEYTQLSNADELAQKVGEIINVLSGEKIAALTHISRQKSAFEQLVKLAPNLADAAASYENARLELHEVAHTLRIFEGSIEHNPERAALLDSRLELINRIKRKYGPLLEDVQTYYTRTKEKLQTLENADADIESLQTKLNVFVEKTEALSAKLSGKRKEAAAKLRVSVLQHLRSLNMSKVEFFVEITPQKRSRHGDDKIEFFLTPNVGEHRVPLRECASGGELSRIMLAIQALLAGKDKTPTLVFDEIDANIGGETAVAVGEKLKEIAAQHQVLCITHFPQVAKLAEHHLRIVKKEIEGRTVTLVDLLNHTSHLEELTRMLGGTAVLK